MSAPPKSNMMIYAGIAVFFLCICVAVGIYFATQGGSPAPGSTLGSAPGPRSAPAPGSTLGSAPGPRSAPAPGSTLGSGSTTPSSVSCTATTNGMLTCTATTNATIVSQNGRFTAAMQSDGNLCIYDNGSYIWGSGSGQSGPHAAYSLAVQSDGNLVIYRAGTSTTIWNIGGTSSTPKAYSLIMQNDGNLCLYPLPLGQPSKWCSGTGGR